jgi:hypothetical protein
MSINKSGIYLRRHDKPMSHMKLSRATDLEVVLSIARKFYLHSVAT